MHKPGWVENELRRIVDRYPHGTVSEAHFQMLVAEALLMLLERTNRKKSRGKSDGA